VTLPNAARPRLLFLRSVAAMFILLATVISVHASSSVIHSFLGGTDGSTPGTSLVFDSAGNLYGATQLGGNHACTLGCGTVFELSPATGGGWTESVIYNFQGGAGDGASPIGGLTIDANGNIYGITSGGGPNGCGTVYRLSPGSGGWTESVLYGFCPSGSRGGGSNPAGNLIFNSAGILYGITAHGGRNNTGVAYSLTPTTSGMWTQTVLYTFPATGGALGNSPAGIIFDSGGTLWGVTSFGGTSGMNGAGVVFQLIKNASGVWTQRVIKTFSTNAADVQTPTGGMIFDSSGNLYITMSRGAQGGASVFELSPVTGGNYQGHVLHSLQGPKLVQPYEAIAFDSAGSLYSASSVGGGSCDCGLVYKLTPSGSSWLFDVLLTMNGTSGNQPIGGVALDNAGDAFVATQFGGSHNVGVVLELTP
jgi:uncharacterized repeat protein (TIGR03803 family)